MRNKDVCRHSEVLFDWKNVTREMLVEVQSGQLIGSWCKCLTQPSKWVRVPQHLFDLVDVVELADTLVVEASASGVRVRVSPSTF